MSDQPTPSVKDQHSPLTTAVIEFWRTLRESSTDSVLHAARMSRVIDAAKEEGRRMGHPKDDAEDVLESAVRLVDGICKWLAEHGHKDVADLLHEDRNTFLMPLAKIIEHRHESETPSCLICEEPCPYCKDGQPRPGQNTVCDHVAQPTSDGTVVDTRGCIDVGAPVVPKIGTAKGLQGWIVGHVPGREDVVEVKISNGFRYTYKVSDLVLSNADGAQPTANPSPGRRSLEEIVSTMYHGSSDNAFDLGWNAALDDVVARCAQPLAEGKDGVALDRYRIDWLGEDWERLLAVHHVLSSDNGIESVRGAIDYVRELRTPHPKPEGT